MIGVDTNLLIRLVLDDDPAQTRRAHALVLAARDRGERLFVNRVVLCEAVWVLRRRMRLDRDWILRVLESWLATRAFVIEDREEVTAAVAAARVGRVDFADALIGLTNARVGCATTYSFDADATVLPTFSAVPD